MMDITTKKECWSELFAVWLKSIGATVVVHSPWGITGTIGKFIHNYTDYKWSVYSLGHDAPLRLDIGYSVKTYAWAAIDLNVENIDIMDPSFDPDTFFKPFKEWLLEGEIHEE